MRYVLGLIGLLAGLVVGNELPDIDQHTSLLLHRSVLTHGPLVPLLALVAVSGSRSIPLRWFAMGVGLGVAVHLGFDLFPQRWSGYALISIPGYGWTTAVASWAWIALSMVTCMYAAAKLVCNRFEAGLFVAGLIGLFGNVAMAEEALWRPMAAVTVAAIVAAALATRKAK